MYTPSLSGQAAVGAAAARLAALRAQLTALTFSCALLSEAEQLRANHSIHECENVDRLTRWLINTRVELARRARARELAVNSVAAPSPTLICYATGARKQHIQPHLSRTQRIRVLVGINRLTRAGATMLRRQLALPPSVDEGPAEALDRRVAAKFCSSSSLTYADLVRC